MNNPYGYVYEEIPIYSENVPPYQYPGYKLISPIGKGYFGTVWKAIRLEDKKVIALKVIKIPESRPDMVKLLYNEVKILTKISSPECHPFLACFNNYMYLKDTNEFIIDMDLIEGKNLYQYAIRIDDPNVKYRHLLLILKDITKAIMYLHNNGIIHNDIKPDNIIVDEYLTPKLVDFGVSCIETKQCVINNELKSLCCDEVIGPNLYISPETLKTKSYYTQSDIWSLGVALYVTATGSYPFTVSTVKELYYHILNKPIEKLNTSNEILNYIVNKALDKNPMTRITLTEIEEILKDI